MTSLRIVILHQALGHNPPPDELDVLSEVRAVRSALKSLGHRASVVAMTESLEQTRGKLRRARPDCVFNLVESILGCGALATAATALLDAENIVYTGAGTAAMALTTDKVASKNALRRAGIATPGWVLPHEHHSFEPGTYIFKPVSEDASVGLGVDALARIRTLSACRHELAVRGQRDERPLFAERFIEGREFNISLIGTHAEPKVLPVAEIEFRGFKERKKPTLVDYRAKWDTSSFEYQNTTRKFATSAADRSLCLQLQHIAKEAWWVLGCRGYARVDLRVDRKGRPLVLEVNANPCIAPDAGFVAAAIQAKMTYDSLIDRIIRVALPN